MLAELVWSMRAFRRSPMLAIAAVCTLSLAFAVNVAVFSVVDAEEEVARLSERPRFLAWLLSAFAGLALLLAAMGLYGVASYLVTQRTRDIGVRMALGAERRDIVRQVFGEAGRWAMAASVGGALLAWAVTQTIESQLFGVARADPVSWAGTFAVLAVALLAAVVRPAAHAARVDPVAALQAD